jgi:hypothetical protein
MLSLHEVKTLISPGNLPPVGKRVEIDIQGPRGPSCFKFWGEVAAAQRETGCVTIELREVLGTGSLQLE